MSRSKALQKSLPPLILVFSLFAIYLSTLAPGLTWANAGSDGGDLVTAAATGGIPHPTGYPLYLLFARLFQFLPVGSLAFRTNVFSAVTTALAALLVYGVVTRSSPRSSEVQYWPAGMAAGYAFGLAPLIWSQAVITEVYGLQSLMVALILYLYTVPSEAPLTDQKRLDFWRGLILGLAVCNHVTTILLTPVALLVGCLRIRGEPDDVPHSVRSWFGNLKLNGRAFLRQLAMFVAGLSLYLIIPLRALANPPVNWGNAVTLERFWWLVSGQLYQSYYLQFAPAELWERIQAWAALLLQQFGVAAVLFGLIGLVVFGTRSRLSILTAWMAIVFTAFAVSYRSVDSYIYLMPVYLSFAIWIGLAIVGLVQQFGKRSSIVRFGLGLLVMVYFAGRSITVVSEVDASQDSRAESFGREVLSAAPENAIVFAEGDQAVSALWYFHLALRERPDLDVLATDLLHFDWYQENLRATYPSLLIPGPFPWPETISGANSERPVCSVRYSDHTELNCSEPLSAP